MPQVVITQKAAAGLNRCRQFLYEVNPSISFQAAQIIQHHFSLLQESPEMGRVVDVEHELRELIIPFGQSGYVALYVIDGLNKKIMVLSFKHQKEAGY